VRTPYNPLSLRFHFLTAALVGDRGLHCQLFEGAISLQTHLELPLLHAGGFGFWIPEFFTTVVVKIASYLIGPWALHVSLLFSALCHHHSLPPFLPPSPNPKPKT